MNYFKLFAFILLICWLSGSTPSKNYDIAIKNITLIDVKNSNSIPHQTILIKGNVIEKIEKYKKYKRISADTIIEGTGKFILPGFWDMHIHICWKENLNNLFPTLFSYGITGVRDMGGDLTILNKFKNQIKDNPQSGPTLFGAGPILDGEKPVHTDFSTPLTQNTVRQILDSLYGKKIDFLKVYSLLPRSVLDSIAIYAREKNIPFAGHVSEYITPEEASAMGQKSFEHLNRLEELYEDSARLRVFSNIAKIHKTWICPTLIIYQRKAEFVQNKFYIPSLYNDLDDDLKNEWQQIKKKLQIKIPTPEDTFLSQKRFENQKKLVKKFYDNGIPILLGTDFAGMPFIYPGLSFHEEMALLQEIGIPPHDILKMATLNPAKFLGINAFYGTVDQNKIADLIILNKNPLIDIKNALAIDCIIKSGKVVSSKNY